MYRLLLIAGLLGFANANGLGLADSQRVTGAVGGLFGNDYLVALAVAIALQPWLSRHLDG